MAYLPGLILAALMFVLAHQFVKHIRFLNAVKYAIGGSTKTYLEIKESLKTDEKSLTWALNVLEKSLKIIQRLPGDRFKLVDGIHP